MARFSIALVLLGFVAFAALTAKPTEARPGWRKKLGHSIDKNVHKLGHSIDKGAHKLGHNIEKGVHELGDGIEKLAEKAEPTLRHIVKKAAECTRQLVPHLPALNAASTCITAAVGAGTVAGGNIALVTAGVVKCGVGNQEAAKAVESLAKCIGH